MITEGAYIIPQYTSPSFRVRPGGFLITAIARITRRSVHANESPDLVISPRNATGSWIFPGSRGQIAIKLSQPIVIQAVGIDYLDTDDLGKLDASPLSPVPRFVEVWGSLPASKHFRDCLIRNHAVLGDPLPSGVLGRKERFFRLGSFEFGLHHSSQVFYTMKKTNTLSIQSDAIIIRILENWGSESHTVLNRIGVYGNPIRS